MNKNIATRMMLASLFLKTKDPDNLLISPSAPKMIREMSPVQKCSEMFCGTGAYSLRVLNL